MSDRTDELERRLQRHRSTSDRSTLLQSRVQAHRAPRASQEDRQRELVKHHDSGVNRLNWDFVEGTPEAAVRWDDIGALELAVRKSVEAAVAFRTGVLSLDVELGGGVPAGAMEIYGEESVGKTSLLIGMIRSAQQSGRKVALCPSEYFDGCYFKKLGVDLSKLLLMRGACEDVLIEAGRWIVDSGGRALFIDSATGVRPHDDQFDNWRVMMGTWLAAVHPRVTVDSAIVMTNQVRHRRSIDAKKMFAGGTDSTARRIANLFDTRLALTRDSVTETEYDMVIDIVSNTLRPPSVILTVPVVKGNGIDVWRDLVRVATEVGVLEQRGSWYYYEETTVAQGEEAVARLLEKNSEAGKIIMEDTLRCLHRS